MKTVIEQLFKDIDTYGIEQVLNNKTAYLSEEEILIKSAWRNGRNSGLMGTHTNATEFYNNLIQEENESKK